MTGVTVEEARALRRAAGRPSTADPKDPAWLRRQRRLFTNYINSKLVDRSDIPPITCLTEDLKSGVVLYALLEVLSGQSLASLGRIAKPRGGRARSRIDDVANLSICFRYVKDTTKIVGIGPADLADGNETLILGLLWSLIVFFSAKDLGGLDDLSALKKKLLKWAQKRTAANKDVDVKNLKSSFADGRAFLAILSDVDPSATPYAPAADADARANFAAAFAAARCLYGVPELLDASDADLWKDDQSMVTYLCELMRRLPEVGAGAAALKFVDARADRTAADLADLARIPSVEADASACAACAAKLAAIAMELGLATSVDERGVVSAAAGNADGPTVLLVGAYGLDAPPPGAEDPWAAHIAGGRVAAHGALEKAGALAPLVAAAASAAEGRLECDVRVLLARTPADAARAVAALDRAPDYALVDAAGALAGAATRAGEYGVAFSCRGEVAVAVEHARAAGGTAAAAAVGPVLDANQGLCAALAPLRARAMFEAADAGSAHGRAGLSGLSASLSVRFDDGAGVAAGTVPGAAAAVVDVALPPLIAPGVGADAVAAALGDPRGGSLKTAPSAGRRGFCSALAEPFLGSLRRAAGGAKLGASEAYLPLAAAVADASPATATYAVGVDPGPAEGAGLADLARAIKALVSLVGSSAAIPRRASAAPVEAAALYGAPNP